MVYEAYNEQYSIQPKFLSSIYSIKCPTDASISLLSTAANLFLFVTWYYSLTASHLTSLDWTSTSIFLTAQLVTASLSLTFATTKLLSVPISPSERSDIKYTWMQSALYQNVFNLAEHLSVKRGLVLAVHTDLKVCLPRRQCQFGRRLPMLTFCYCQNVNTVPV
jgi:hypothetical protein